MGMGSIGRKLGSLLLNKVINPALKQKEKVDFFNPVSFS